MLGYGSLTFSSLEAKLWAFRVRECVRCLERHRKVGSARGMSRCGGCNPPVEYRVSTCAHVSCRYLQHDLKVAWRRMCLPIHLDFLVPQDRAGVLDALLNVSGILEQDVFGSIPSARIVRLGLWSLPRLLGSFMVPPSWIYVAAFSVGSLRPRAIHN